LKFCTICKLARLDQQEPLWFQFTCMCRMILKLSMDMFNHPYHLS
jgi:hypothetical protein